MAPATYHAYTSVYNREAAITYARQWALSRNPAYYNYDNIGGDCTNFASQCLYAGSLVMNYQRTFGWYYISTNNHSPSWTGVPYLYNYLTRTSGIGPIGINVSMEEIKPGDIIQLASSSANFTHSLVVVAVGEAPSIDNILICAHSDDSLDRVLSTYEYADIRYIHITGVIK